MDIYEAAVIYRNSMSMGVEVLADGFGAIIEGEEFVSAEELIEMAEEALGLDLAENGMERQEYIDLLYGYEEDGGPGIVVDAVKETLHTEPAEGVVKVSFIPPVED